MLRRLVVLTLRTLRRQSGYALVSGLGVSLALACTCLVASYVAFETSYDTFHEDAEDIGRIYRIAKENPSDSPYPRVQGLVGRRLKERVTGIEHETSINAHNRPVFLRKTEGSASSEDNQLRIESRRAFYVGAGDEFFDVFSGFEVVSGNAKTAFQEPGNAVVTRSTALRLFGTTDVLGRNVTLKFGIARIPQRTVDRDEEALTIRAVTADTPARSHLQYDVLYSVDPASLRRSWSGAYLYVELAPGADKQAILSEMLPAYDTVYKPSRGAPFSERFDATFEPLTSIHLYSPADRALSPRTDVRYLWALALLTLVLLGVAGVNYTNLAAVMYASRSAEVGARKAIGAHDGDIARQFVGESILLALLCVPVAMLLASGLTPPFNQLMNVDLSVPATSPLAWTGMILGAVLFGAVASLYPARTVARNSVQALFQGSTFRRGRGLTTRRVLIVVQFALFVALGSGALLMHQQMTLLSTEDLGFDPDGLGEITNGAALLGALNEDRTQRDVSTSKAFQQEVRSHPDVVDVSSGFRFLEEEPGRLRIQRSGDASRPEFEASWSFMNPDAPDLLGLSLRNSNYLDAPPDERRTGVAIVNQTALQNLGCSVDQLDDCRVDTAFDNFDGLPVVGVLEPVQLASMRYSAPPVVFLILDQEDRVRRSWHRIFVRFEDDVSVPEQREIMQAAWTTFVTERPMEYASVEERIQGFYAQDRRLRTLGLGLTGITLVLVMLGLIAMAAYLTRLRLKEVAIRKALGASLSSLLALLNREFVTLVGIAVAVGSPVSYLVMDGWLARFATRVDVSPLTFLAVGTGALALAVAAVTWQSLSTARVDPARVLQSER